MAGRESRELSAAPGTDMMGNMKTISVAVSEADYEAFQEAAKETHRSAAQLIREAMTFFREQRLEHRSRLEQLPVFPGSRPISPLPSRVEVYDEVFGDPGADEAPA